MKPLDPRPELDPIEMPWRIEKLEVVDDGLLHIVGPEGQEMLLYAHDLELFGWSQADLPTPDLPSS